MRLLAAILIVATGISCAPGVPEITSNVPNFADEPRHPVTADMEERALRQKQNKAPLFSLPDEDAKTWTLADCLGSTGAVFVMTKDGCPCSIEAQPFLNMIAKAYAGKIGFFGVMDAGRPIASLFHSSMSMTFPLLADPKLEAIEGFQAKQSVYTYLVGPDEKIVKVWPGYSQHMLKELSEMSAKAAGVEPADLDFSDAPKQASSGCAFYGEDPFLVKS